MSELTRVAPELVRRVSVYLFWDAKGSVHGVDQGDPLAPLLFAWGMRPRLIELEKRLKEFGVAAGLTAARARVLAYLDDVIIAVPPTIASQVLGVAAEVFQGFGLILREDETQA